jgi:tRNA(His) guanylyltransferase
MSLGDFFKQKEAESGSVLKPKGFYIIRLDGKAFHTFTRGCEKPFDQALSNAMVETTKRLCESIQNVKMGYTQSDEISLVLSDISEANPHTSLWYNGAIQKIVSVSSSMCTAFFNNAYKSDTLAFFDSRIFRLESIDEVGKYLLWRQRDAIKNGVTLISLKHYSHKAVNQKNSQDKIEMIEAKGDNLTNYDLGHRQGFSLNRHLIEVPFVNPKTLVSGLVERSIWKAEASESFSVEMLADFKKFTN